MKNKKEMDTSKKEIRSIEHRVSLNEESRQIEGYALLFDQDSTLIGGSFIERISKDAMEGVLQRSDVLCMLNHDESRGVLARYRRGAGSLKLEVDERGLRYSFEAPKTALGDELIESVRRGDIDSSSFAFSTEKDSWGKRDDNVYVRTILQIGKIYDVSPVYTPAYNDTSVSLRSLGELKEAEQRSIVEAEEKALKEYYKQVEERF